MASDRPEANEPARLWVEAWHADRAEPLRVQRAYRRFLASQVADAGASRPTPLGAVRWVALGVVLGTSSLLAATRVAAWLAPPTTVAPVPSFSAPAPPRQSVSKIVNQEPLPSASSSSKPEVASPPAPSVSARAPGSASDPELWQRAARSLHDRDFEGANAALTEVVQNGSASERESARLVQAQILLAQGQTRDAELSLRELAASARSPKVRQKARELLQIPRQNLSSERSFSIDEGANDP